MTHQILNGDAIEKLRTLPDNSVHCVVTSPPYWQLRDYRVDGQIGLERTIDEYLAKIVAVFEEVRRVLRMDGTCWVNIGDCHYSSGGSGRQGASGQRSDRRHTQLQLKRGNHAGLKPKDLCGIPWRVAFALQSAGWYLRSDIIWHKPNPVPGSYQDRPTTAHEYVFLLAKSAKYFYDIEAIKEPVTGNAHARGNGVNPKAKVPSGWDTRNGNHREKVGRYKVKQNASFSSAVSGLVSKRNKRDVWTIPTKAYPGNHYATFPPDLVKPCVLAGTSEKGCCVQCGRQYTRVVKNGAPNIAHQRQCGGDKNGEYFGKATKDFNGARAQDASATKARILAGMVEKITVGWKAQCECNAAVIPCTVLDPFAGSGTTGLVAAELRRSSIMIELDGDQCKIIDKRLGQIQPQFAI